MTGSWFVGVMISVLNAPGRGFPSCIGIRGQPFSVPCFPFADPTANSVSKLRLSVRFSIIAATGDTFSSNVGNAP